MSDNKRSEPENIETDSAVEEPEAKVSENFEIISVKHHTLSNLEKQRQDTDDMCVVILKVEDTEFPAHRLVLSASNDYIFKMFVHNRHARKAQQESHRKEHYT